MNGKLLALASSMALLTACVVAHRPGGGVEVIPILPFVVEIGDDDYYQQDGYHYHYSNDRWYYSNSRDGARRELPRSHWPKETRRRGRGHGR
jgi:hypothetical protein